MRIPAALAAILLLGAGSAVQQGDLTIPARIDEEAVAFTLAQAEQVIELARATRTITVAGGDGTPIERPSDLRVSLVVLDLGPATDVSPRQALHLAMFNDIEEHGIAWALVPVADVWTFRSVERREAGIYVIEAEIAAFSTAREGCFFQLARITVDARALSVAVRSAPGLSEFGGQRYDEPVAISHEMLSCLR